MGPSAVPAEAPGREIQHDVFLSYNSSALESVSFLDGELRRRGLRTWLDKPAIDLGEKFMSRIAEGMKASRSCVVVLGAHAIHPYQRYEMEQAAYWSVNDPAFRVIPVYLPGSRYKLNDPPPILIGFSAFDFRSLWENLDEFLDKVAKAVSGAVSAEPPPAACPYKNLEFFDVADAPNYFGREVATQRVLEKLRSILNEPGRPARFLAIVGASGSGKSSLARAGVLAALTKGDIAGSEHWPITILDEFSSNPLLQMAQRLGAARLDGQTTLGTVESFCQDVLHDHTKLDNAIEYLLDGSPRERRHVILVDPLEACLGDDVREEHRRAFIEALLHAAAVPGGRALVIVTLRADVLGRCERYSKLWAALNDGQELPQRMEEEDLRCAVIAPARLAHATLEPGLPDLLVNEVIAAGPGCLPLLQYTLTELWGKRVGRLLTHQAYRDTGGIQGILGRRAKTAFETLTKTGKGVCFHVCFRLVRKIGEDQYARARRQFPDLIAPNAREEDVRVVVRTLAGKDYRLITTGADVNPRGPVGGAAREQVPPGQEWVELSHDSIIAAWKDFRKYLDSHEQFLEWQERFRPAFEARQQPNALLTGFLLREAVEKREEWGGEIGPLEHSFINESVRRERVRRWTLRAVLMLSVAALIVAAVTFSFQDQESRMALSRKLAADAKNAISTADPDLPVFLALQAWRVRETPEAEEALQQTVQFKMGPALEGHGDGVNAIAFSSDGKRIATGSFDGTVRLWDAVASTEMRSSPLASGASRVMSIAFHPDGRRIAVGTADGAVQLLLIDKPSPSGERLLSANSEIVTVSFSADGKHLLIAPLRGPVEIREEPFAGEHPLWTQAASPVAAADFGPLGRPVAIALKTGQVRLLPWSNSSSGAASRPFELWPQEQSPGVPPAPATGVVYSPSGDRLVATGGGTAAVWKVDAGDRAVPRRFAADPDGADSAVWRPDGLQVAIVGRSRGIRLWNLPVERETIRLWNRPAEVESMTLPVNAGGSKPQSGPFTAVAYSPSAPFKLAAGTQDGKVYMYQLDHAALNAKAKEGLPRDRDFTKECKQYLKANRCPPPQ
jgi:WD40 repeat protein